MTHRLLINYYTAHERHFSSFLVPFVFVCDSFICVRRHFSLYLKFLLTTVYVKTQSAYHKTCTDDSQLWNISLSSTLSITKQQ